MPKSRLLLVILIACLCACAPAGCAPAPAAPAPAIAWQDCQLSAAGSAASVKARCMTLRVPEDRANPAGRQIDLHVAVVASVSRNPEPDPLFILAGGPGQAATEIYPALAAMLDGIHDDREIVLVDQRGAGKSNPLKCDLPEQEATAFVEDKLIAALHECAGKLDADLRFYTTDIAMQDLDAVRAALGYDRINLYGASYGTRAALTYLRAYPQRVRSLVLDAVTSPDFRIYQTAARDGSRALDLLLARCQSDAACHEAFPDLRAELDALSQQLAAQPAPVAMADPMTGKPIEFLLTRDMFSSIVFALLYTPEINALLPLSIHTAYADANFAPLVAQAGALDAGLYNGMLYSVVCTEDAPVITPELAAQQSAGTYFGDMTRVMRQVCAGWPRGRLPADYGAPVPSDVPALLLSGDADPITPPQYAEQVARDLPNSLHLIAPNMGHGILGRGCVSRLVADFIAGGSVAGLDAACVQEIAPPPFFVSFTGPRP